jgi:hypothetical protein
VQQVCFLCSLATRQKLTVPHEISSITTFQNTVLEWFYYYFSEYCLRVEKQLCKCIFINFHVTSAMQGNCMACREADEGELGS